MGNPKNIKAAIEWLKKQGLACIPKLPFIRSEGDT